VILTTSGGGTYNASAVFANVNGLVATGNVEVAGFKVGESPASRSVWAATRA